MADEHDLHRLAPDIDREAAIAAFHRRRRRSRSLRRGAWASAAVVAMVAGTVGVVSSLDDGSPVVADPGHGRPITFELLTQAPASDEMGTLRSATTEGELVELWNHAQHELPQPEIDFDEQVVVSLTTTGGSRATLSSTP